MQAVRLKICDSHLTCKVANKCLNIRERVEVVEWNKRWSPPFPCCPVSRQCLWKKTLIEKKNNSDLLPMALSLELRYNFYIWDPSSQLSHMVFIFVFFFFMSSSAFFHLCLLLFSCHPLLSGCSDFLKKNAISREKQMFKIFIIL